ncbi:MAG: SpoIID/LytB domain-containing protein [Vicinamibacterales bacterium]
MKIRQGGGGLKAAAAAVWLAATACAPAAASVMLPSPATRPWRPVTIRVQVRERTALVVREVPLEDYVATAALSEVHPDSQDPALAQRMFEVQTVIARTYAIANRRRHTKDGFDLCSTTHCQLYEPARLTTSRWAAAAATAARRTAGDLLCFAGMPVNAVFHADCGGHTSNAAAVWGGVTPAYLAGTADRGAAARAHTDWTFDTRMSVLRTALNGDPRTTVGARLDRIEIAGRDFAGRAEMILLRGTRTFVVRGEVFRDVVTRALGVKTLRSTLFSIKVSEGLVMFSGKGFGHGVGLCQAGALARLKAGDSPTDVLEHYFPGAAIEKR